jgi:hypothetical protein
MTAAVVSGKILFAVGRAGTGSGRLETGTLRVRVMAGLVLAHRSLR